MWEMAYFGGAVDITHKSFNEVIANPVSVSFSVGSHPEAELSVHTADIDKLEAGDKKEMVQFFLNALSIWQVSEEIIEEKWREAIIQVDAIDNFREGIDDPIVTEAIDSVKQLLQMFDQLGNNELSETKNRLAKYSQVLQKRESLNSPSEADYYQENPERWILPHRYAAAAEYVTAAIGLIDNDTTMLTNHIRHAIIQATTISYNFVNRNL